MTEVVSPSTQISPPLGRTRLPARFALGLGTLAGIWSCHREVPKAPLNFRLALETEGCASDLAEVIVQLDQHAPASGRAYRFVVDPYQRVLDGTIHDLPEGTYHATVTGRTKDDANTCSQAATVLVASRGTGRASLRLTCDDACMEAAPRIEAIGCPAVEPEVPALVQFTSQPFYVTANEKDAAGRAVWKSKDLNFTPSNENLRAQCKRATSTATATVTAANAACAVSESIDVECIDAKVTVLDDTHVLSSGWQGALAGRKMPVTRAAYRASCQEVEKRQLASAKQCVQVGSYCSCEWTGQSPPGASAAGRTFDGPVLGGAADETISEADLEQLRNQLSDLGRKYLGVPPPPSSGEAPVVQATQAGATTPVRVAVIDTSGVPPYDLQTGLPTQPTDNNLHGRAVALVIADTACSEYDKMDECPVKVHSYLALNVLGSHTGETATIGVDDVHGGHAGTLTDLGLAVRRAVDEWKTVAATTGERLIINISAGWDPVWGGDAQTSVAANGAVSSTTTGAPELVLESLKYANCAGALVFAAAGNRTTPYGSATPETAIYPAAWTTLPAPTAAECEALGVVGANPSAGAPLLYAVGGLDLKGGELMTGRSRGLPLLATVGLNVVRQEPYGSPHHTPTLTGTSMSTAAVSGVAAHLWSHSADARASDLASQLYERGQATPHAADICFGGAACGTVRNIVLCDGNPDKNPMGCDPSPPSLDTPLTAAVEFDTPIPVELNTDDPETADEIAEPWVYPQPPDDPSCRVCQFLNPDNKLDINWTESFDPSRVTQMRIYLDDNNGYWTIPQDIATTRRSFRVVLNGASDGTTAGTVRYKYNTGPAVITIEEALVVP